MRFSKLLDNIQGEFASILRRVDENAAENLVDRIISSDRIFITGMGRSGLIGRPFAMRLTQMGFQAYLVGDATTPAIGQGDLLIAISGSGKTNITHHIADTAKNFGAYVSLITAQPISKIGDISDLVIVLPIMPEPVLPLGSAFEGAAHIFFDAVVMLIMKKMQITQQEMMKRHSNLE